jgi:DNA mismatch endonuclease (patch repair protein)
MLGHLHTKQTRQKIREAILQRYARGWKVSITPSYRRNLSAALRKVNHTWDTKKNYVCSEESRQKYRDARAKKVYPFHDSSLEIMLQNALQARGFIFEKHYPILGQPDFAWPDRRVAVFADGRFFHGDPREFNANDRQLDGKIMKAIWAKDAKITAGLKTQGWTVLRFWEKEIRASPHRCVDDIERCLYELSR